MGSLLERAVKELSPGTRIFKVLTYLSFKGPSFAGQIAEETGIPPGTVYPALRSLLERGFVTQGEDRTYRSKIAFTDIISDLYARHEEKK